MPFDYQKFDVQCSQMSTEELLKSYKHYSKLGTGATAGIATSALSIPFTLGLSGVAIGISASAHHNAKKKKLIIEKYLRARGVQAEQAAQYVNTVANEQAQRNYMEQQSWQNNAGPSSGMDSKRGMPDEKSEKKSAKGMHHHSHDDAPPPPPPTYDEALTGPSQPYAQPQRYSPQPYGQQQQQQQGGWGGPQPNYGAPPPGMYGPPQPGYAGPQYCAPQNMYPNSAMYSGHPVGPDPRHVHFTQ